MTQASLSPDLHPALPTTSAAHGADARPHATSEAALWLITLTASGLVLAAVLLLGLLARNMISDASLGGFVSGIAIMLATIGVGAMAYVLVSARREGWLHSPTTTSRGTTPQVPSGMHVVPAVPADVGHLRRREVQDVRSARSKQALAIATATAASPGPRPVTQPPRTQASSAPRQAPAHRVAPAQVAHPAPARMASSPAVHPAAAAPPTARPAVPPAIRMPLPAMRPARPAAWPMPGAPVIRLPAPRAHPHAQAARYQVNAATIGRPTARPGRQRTARWSGEVR